MKNTQCLAVALTLLCLSGCASFLPKPGSASQAWEYKTIVRSRGFPTGNSVNAAVAATDWTTWYEDGQPIAAPTDPLAKVNQLGAQGWELISVIPRSSLASSWTAGATSDETWIFKRPKS